MTKKTAPIFEHQTCTRCCGTGEHSFNLMHGKVCYGCGGSGVQLTKRGRAAQEFFRQSCMVRLDSLKVGDLMQCEVFAPSGASCRYFGTVVEITPNSGISKSLDHTTGEWVDHVRYAVTTEHPKMGRSGFDAFPSTLVRKGQTAEEKREKIAAALAYQESLTKTGKPKKVA